MVMFIVLLILLSQLHPFSISIEFAFAFDIHVFSICGTVDSFFAGNLILTRKLIQTSRPSMILEDRQIRKRKRITDHHSLLSIFSSLHSALKTIIYFSLHIFQFEEEFNTEHAHLVITFCTQTNAGTCPYFHCALKYSVQYPLAFVLINS